MSTTPNSPPGPPAGGSSTGRTVAWIAGIVFAFLLVCLGGLFLAGYLFFSKVHVTSMRDDKGQEKSVNIDTPLGRLRVEKGIGVDPKLLGIPIYPGASVVQGDHSARVDLDLDFADKSLRVLAAKMETPDNFQKVVDFYKEEVPDFVYTRKSNGRAQFHWEHGEFKKVVMIEERSGKTRISLANIGEPEAN